jgi:hypothetical protein
VPIYIEGSSVSSCNKEYYADSSISEISNDCDVFASVDMRSTRERSQRKLSSEGPSEPSPGIDSLVKKKITPRLKISTIYSKVPPDPSNTELVSMLPFHIDDHDHGGHNADHEFKALIQVDITSPIKPCRKGGKS